MSLKHAIIKVEFSIEENKFIPSILIVNTNTNNASSDWDIVDTNLDGIASILASKIIEDNKETDLRGMYSAIFKDRFAIINGNYTLNKIGEIN